MKAPTVVAELSLNGDSVLLRIEVLEKQSNDRGHISPVEEQRMQPFARTDPAQVCQQSARLGLNVRSDAAAPTKALPSVAGSNDV